MEPGTRKNTARKSFSTGFDRKFLESLPQTVLIKESTKEAYKESTKEASKLTSKELSKKPTSEHRQPTLGSMPSTSATKTFVNNNNNNSSQSHHCKTSSGRSRESTSTSQTLVNKSTVTCRKKAVESSSAKEKSIPTCDNQRTDRMNSTKDKDKSDKENHHQKKHHHRTIHKDDKTKTKSYEQKVGEKAAVEAKTNNTLHKPKVSNSSQNTAVVSQTQKTNASHEKITRDENKTFHKSKSSSEKVVSKSGNPKPPKPKLLKKVIAHSDTCNLHHESSISSQTPEKSKSVERKGSECRSIKQMSPSRKRTFSVTETKLQKDGECLHKVEKDINLLKTSLGITDVKLAKSSYVNLTKLRPGNKIPKDMKMTDFNKSGPSNKAPSSDSKVKQQQDLGKSNIPKDPCAGASPLKRKHGTSENMSGHSNGKGSNGTEHCAKLSDPKKRRHCSGDALKKDLSRSIVATDQSSKTVSGKIDLQRSKESWTDQKPGNSPISSKFRWHSGDPVRNNLMKQLSESSVDSPCTNTSSATTGSIVDQSSGLSGTTNKSKISEDSSHTELNLLKRSGDSCSIHVEKTKRKRNKSGSYLDEIKKDSSLKVKMKKKYWQYCGMQNIICQASSKRKSLGEDKSENSDSKRTSRVEAQVSVTANEQSVGATVEQCSEDAVAQTTETIVKQTVEAVDDKHAEITVHKSAEVIAHKPAEVLAHKPAEVLAHKPAEVLAHKLAEVLAHQPAEAIVDKPGEATVQQSEATIHQSAEDTVLQNMEAIDGRVEASNERVEASNERVECVEAINERVEAINEHVEASKEQCVNTTVEQHVQSYNEQDVENTFGDQNLVVDRDEHMDVSTADDNDEEGNLVIDLGGEGKNPWTEHGGAAGDASSSVDPMDLFDILLFEGFPDEYNRRKSVEDVVHSDIASGGLRTAGDASICTENPNVNAPNGSKECFGANLLNTGSCAKGATQDQDSVVVDIISRDSVSTYCVSGSAPGSSDHIWLKYSSDDTLPSPQQLQVGSAESTVQPSQTEATWAESVPNLAHFTGSTVIDMQAKDGTPDTDAASTSLIQRGSGSTDKDKQLLSNLSTMVKCEPLKSTCLHTSDSAEASHGNVRPDISAHNKTFVSSSAIFDVSKIKKEVEFDNIVHEQPAENGIPISAIIDNGPNVADAMRRIAQICRLGSVVGDTNSGQIGTSTSCHSEHRIESSFEARKNTDTLDAVHVQQQPQQVSAREQLISVAPPIGDSFTKNTNRPVEGILGHNPPTRPSHLTDEQTAVGGDIDKDITTVIVDDETEAPDEHRLAQNMEQFQVKAPQTTKSADTENSRRSPPASNVVEPCSYIPISHQKITCNKYTFTTTGELDPEQEYEICVRCSGCLKSLSPFQFKLHYHINLIPGDKLKKDLSLNSPIVPCGNFLPHQLKLWKLFRHTLHKRFPGWVECRSSGRLQRRTMPPGHSMPVHLVSTGNRTLLPIVDKSMAIPPGDRNMSPGGRSMPVTQGNGTMPMPPVDRNRPMGTMPILPGNRNILVGTRPMLPGDRNMSMEDRTMPPGGKSMPMTQVDGTMPPGGRSMPITQVDGTMSMPQGGRSMPMAQVDGTMSMPPGGRSMPMTQVDGTMSMPPEGRSMPMIQVDGTMSMPQGGRSMPMTQVDGTMSMPQGGRSMPMTQVDGTMSMPQGDRTHLIANPHPPFQAGRSMYSNMQVAPDWNTAQNHPHPWTHQRRKSVNTRNNVQHGHAGLNRAHGQAIHFPPPSYAVRPPVTPDAPGHTQRYQQAQCAAPRGNTQPEQTPPLSHYSDSQNVFARAARPQMGGNQMGNVRPPSGGNQVRSDLTTSGENQVKSDRPPSGGNGMSSEGNGDSHHVTSPPIIRRCSSEANQNSDIPTDTSSLDVFKLIQLSQKCELQAVIKLCQQRTTDREELTRMRLELAAEVQHRREIESTVSSLKAEVAQLKTSMAQMTQSGDVTQQGPPYLLGPYKTPAANNMYGQPTIRDSLRDEHRTMF